ncbi:hypothetical protein Tco_0309907 [Tanacetum coccineum]
MSTQEYIQKVVKDVGEDDDFKSGSWVSVTNYVNTNCGTVNGYLGDIKNFLKNGKLDQVDAIVKSCSLNAIGDLTVTMKDLTSTIPEPKDDVATIMRRRHDIHGDGVRDSATASGRGRLKVDLEPSTWRRRQEYKATLSQ